jgi:hypothetical protein
MFIANVDKFCDILYNLLITVPKYSRNDFPFILHFNCWYVDLALNKQASIQTTIPFNCSAVIYIRPYHQIFHSDWFTAPQYTRNLISWPLHLAAELCGIAALLKLLPANPSPYLEISARFSNFIFCQNQHSSVPVCRLFVSRLNK